MTNTLHAYNKKHLKFNLQNVVAFLLVAFSPILSTLNFITNSIGVKTIYDTILLYSIALVILTIYLLKTNIRKKAILIFPASYILILLFSLTIHLNFSFFETAIFEYSMNILYFFIGASFTYDDERRDVMISASKLSVLLSFIIILAQNVFFQGSLQGDMSAAYILLFPILILINSFFVNNRLESIIFSVLGLLTLLLYGTRGPVLIVLAYAALYLILYGKKKLRIGLIVLIICIILFSDTLLKYSLLLLEEVGAIRLYNLLSSGSFLEGGGREYILKISINQIQSSPVLGLGMYGDRVFLSSINASYPHNFIVEVFLQYGIPLGVVVLLVYAFFVGIKYKQCDSQEKKVVFLLFTMTVLKLLLSSSYLNEQLLFFLIGFLIIKERD